MSKLSFVCAVSVAVATAVGALQASAADRILVRPAVNGRVWQVNLAPSDPIRWAWAMGSDAARLTVTNLIAQTIAEQVVTRTDGELFGSYAISIPTSPAEQVCTLAIEQYYHYGKTDQQTIDSSRARIAYLPGIHGAAIDVRPLENRYHGEKAEVFSYDARWSAASMTATVASVMWKPAGSAAVTRVLDGTSGYDVVAPETVAKADLSLLFDGVAHWTRLVKFGANGLIFVVR